MALGLVGRWPCGEVKQRVKPTGGNKSGLVGRVALWRGGLEGGYTVFISITWQTNIGKWCPILFCDSFLYVTCAI